MSFLFPVWKKSYARVLATVAEATKDGGVTIEDMCPIIEQQYGKKCSPDVALSLARSLLMDKEYLAVDEGNHKWTCTKKGLAEYKRIKESVPALLEKTTSPRMPMHI